MISNQAQNRNAKKSNFSQKRALKEHDSTPAHYKLDCRMTVAET